MRLVIDASAAVNTVVPSQLRAATLRRLEGAELSAPALVDTEVLSALGRLERTHAITTSEADAGMRAWQRLPCTRVDTEPLLSDIWALRHSIRITDAHYVVLGRFLDATVLTADARLGRAPLRGVSVLTIT